jgi:hypothetical protein
MRRHAGVQTPARPRDLLLQLWVAEPQKFVVGPRCAAPALAAAWPYGTRESHGCHRARCDRRSAPGPDQRRRDATASLSRLDRLNRLPGVAEASARDASRRDRQCGRVGHEGATSIATAPIVLGGRPAAGGGVRSRALASEGAWDEFTRPARRPAAEVGAIALPDHRDPVPLSAPETRRSRGSSAAWMRSAIVLRITMKNAP